MYAPGYYKTNYRGLRFRELRRMHGPFKGIKAYLISRFLRPTPAGWMPSLWADMECKPEDLSADFWQATKPHREDFARLGFTQCGLVKVTMLNPLVREAGGMTFLDSTRRQFGQLFYNRLYVPSKGAELRRLIIAFTADFEQGSLSCTNNRGSFDPPDENEVIRVDSYDVPFIHAEFLRRVQGRRESPREFPDLESLKKWFDDRQVKAFEERARRRLFLPMTEQEVADAKARASRIDYRLQPAKPWFSWRWALWLAVVGCILLLQVVRNYKVGRFDARNDKLGRSDAFEYRGQQFKMRKAYASYEDYKDDPNNLDTNELERIEAAMVSAQIPPSFKSREELVHFVIYNLKFPGYGLSMGGEAQTDDGSTLEMESVEIPQREKDRVIVVRGSDGKFRVVDDFIYGTATNAIQRVKLEKGTLRYYDATNRVVREKTI